MPEEATQVEETIEAPSQNQPEEPSVESGQPTYFDEKFDPASLPPELQSRYKEMQGDYTRKTQELAQQRQEAENAIAIVQALENEDTRDEAFQYVAEQLGYEVAQELADEMGLEELEEEPQFFDPRVDQLLQIQEEQQIQQLDQKIQSQIDAAAKSAKLELTEAERSYVFRITAEMGPDAQGEPQVGEAMKQLQAILDAQAERLAKSKEPAPSPPLPGGNSPTPATPTADDPKARQLKALEVANRSMASSGG